MNQPLAWAAGNALEIREAIEFVRGKRHPRLEEVTLALAAAALRRIGLAPDTGSALSACRTALESGRAAESMSRMVATQGGPADFIERFDRYLVVAPVIEPLPAPRSGWVESMDTRSIGLVVMYLGGGRQQLADKIDHRVGLSGLCSIGDRIEEGDPLAFIHAASSSDWDRAAESLLRSIDLSTVETQRLPCVHDHIG